METEAHCEMKEIEEMLSLFGSDASSTTVDSQDKRFNHLISVHVCLANLALPCTMHTCNKLSTVSILLFIYRPNPISIAKQAPEVDFDSLLNEMNHIEGKSH